MFDTILFDLDGTISDSGPGITRSVAYSLKKFGIIIDDISTLNYFVGPPLKDSFRNNFGFDEEQSEKAVEYYREWYRDKGIHETTVYPGMAELVRKLHDMGKTIALATSKPTVFAKMVIEDYGLTDCFDLILGCELDGSRVEKPEIIAECLEFFGITEEEKHRAVMIGDRCYDILGARACGIASIGLTFGYAPEGEMEEVKPDYIAHSAEDIYSILVSQ